jgi:adenine-specific DNA-methyltransferase
MVFAPGYLHQVTKQDPIPLRLPEGRAPDRRAVAHSIGDRVGLKPFTARIVVGDPEHASRNLVVFGDNERAMQQLLDEGLTAAVDLVYVDPPFNTGRVFDTFDGRQGYSDIWPSERAFLFFLRTRLRLVKELMSSRGSFYLHIDRKVGYRARVVIDRTIGREHFRNEITRVKCNPKNSSREAYGNTTDAIYFYSHPDAIWNDLREPLTDEQITSQYTKTDPYSGRRYTTSPLYAPGVVKDGPTGGLWRGMLPPPGKHWSRSPAELDELDRQGLIEWSATGNPRRKLYAGESLGTKIQDVWVFKDKGGSRDRYPTEKNLELLERVVQQSSAPGSVVLDCFMGSGTTLVAAAKHGRRFIGIDESHTSLAETLRRLTHETAASFTVIAAEPLVEDSMSDVFNLQRDGEEACVRLRDSAEAGRVRALLLAHRDDSGVWHAEPLREGAGGFAGRADDRSHTHLLVVDAGGSITATPIESASPAEHRAKAPDCARRWRTLLPA